MMRVSELSDIVVKATGLALSVIIRVGTYAMDISAPKTSVRTTTVRSDEEDSSVVPSFKNLS